jgi:hypothetical protein
MKLLANNQLSTKNLNQAITRFRSIEPSVPQSQKQAASLRRTLSTPAAASPVGDLLLRHLTVPGSLLDQNVTSIVIFRQLF